MKTGTSLKNRQGGAVAVMVAAGLVMIIGFLALVMDLGHLYLARTGQQNAADAAALAGAKELDGSQAGIDNAVAWAQKLTAQGSGDNTGKRNQFFGGLGWEDVVLDQADIHFSDSPYSSNWVTVADAREQSVGKYFIKVDTQSGPMDTWFARIWNIFFTSTYGSAVAGRFMTPITPLGVCAIDPANPEKWEQYGDAAADNYKLEYGFAYGVSYDLGQVNKVIGGLTNGAPLYLHPTAQTREQCEPEQNNANFPVPFMCTGRSAISGRAGSYVYANTGWGGPDIYDSLNTRFVFDPNLSKYDLNASICLPDANIREFGPGVASGWMTANETIDQTVRIGSNENDKGRSLAAWLAKTNVIPFDEIKARSEANGGCSKQPGPVVDCTNNYGVLWSYARPTKQSGTLIPPGDWNTGVANTSLYREGPTANNYPTTGYDPSGVNLPASPYAQGLATKTGPYYLEGPGGLVGRRVLNLVILNCQDVATNPGCDGVRVLRVGKFFMQVKAEFAPGKKVEVEFAGLVPEAELSQDIRLYR